jgi:hypothetical protein
LEKGKSSVLSHDFMQIKINALKVQLISDHLNSPESRVIPFWFSQSVKYQADALEPSAYLECGGFRRFGFV